MYLIFCGRHGSMVTNVINGCAILTAKSLCNIHKPTNTMWIVRNQRKIINSYMSNTLLLIYIKECLEHIFPSDNLSIAIISPRPSLFRHY